MGPTLEELEFYRRALATNAAGNNRSWGQNRPSRFTDTFAVRGGPARPLACSLLGREHQGDVAVYWYHDRGGVTHYQVFCAGCATSDWKRLDPDDDPDDDPAARRARRKWRAKPIYYLGEG